MHYIVVDIEATCDQNNPLWDRANMEPIEIGAVAVNEKLEIIGEFSTFIRPVKFPKLSNFCKELTSIKQEQVDIAPIYKDAYKDFEKWAFGFENPIFCSWGGYDAREMKRNCEKDKVKFNFKTCLNLKNLFSKTQSLNRELGLKKALSYSGLIFEGIPHRGIDDAKNTARLLKYSCYNNIIVKK